ncbi:MAG: hypothetical protein ABIK09_06730 [Pseudomonadota bacterium]
MTALLLTLAFLLPAAPPPPALQAPEGLAAGTAAEWEATVRTLIQRFDGYLEDPGAYGRRVRDQCRRFPEGDLFPFTFPALAYGHLALRDPGYRDHALRQMAALLDLAIPATVERVKARKGRLRSLGSYGGHAVYLCQLGLALGLWRAVGGDDRYEADHQRLADVIREALLERNGPPLDSFPGVVYPFDTIPCLVLLAQRDRQDSAEAGREPIERHLLWVRDHGTDPDTGLPVSRVDPETFSPVEVPRGCDLSLRIPLMAQLDPAAAKALWARYVKRYWLERWIVKGLAEWPDGRRGVEDMDSGPILMGVGLAASSLGLGAALMAGDSARLATLLGYMARIQDLLTDAAPEGFDGATVWIGGMIPTQQGYVTGFLYGDATLFLSLTWTLWAGP